MCGEVESWIDVGGRADKIGRVAAEHHVLIHLAALFVFLASTYCILYGVWVVRKIGIQTFNFRSGRSLKVQNHSSVFIHVLICIEKEKGLVRTWILFHFRMATTYL